MNDAIRDAIATIADEAHPPQRIRAVLDARLRHHRQRRVVLRVAGTAAAAAVAGVAGAGVYRLTRAEDTVFPEVAGGPGGGWLQAAPRWRPGTLPAGFGLTTLGAVIDGDRAVVASRTWTRPQREKDRSDPFVAVTTGWSDVYERQVAPSRTEAVDVRGVRGELRTFPDDGGVELGWQPPGEPMLTVSVMLYDPERDRAVALQVARSLVRDLSTIAVGPRAGWLPDRFAGVPWFFRVSAVEGAWGQSVSLRTPAADMTVAAGPRVGQWFDRSGTEPVRVGGEEAWLRAVQGMLLATAPGGFEVVVVAAGSPPAELVRIAETFDHGPVPDMTWYGTR